MLFKVPGIHDMSARFAEGGALSIPDTVVRNTYISNFEGIRVSMVGTQLFGISLAILLMTTPLLVLVYLEVLTASWWVGSDLTNPICPAERPFTPSSDCQFCASIGTKMFFNEARETRHLRSFHLDNRIWDVSRNWSVPNIF